MEEVIRDGSRAGSVLVPAEPVKELLALTTLEVSILNGEGACIGELDVGLIGPALSWRVLLTGPPVMVGASLVPVILIATVVRSVSTPSVTVTS